MDPDPLNPQHCENISNLDFLREYKNPGFSLMKTVSTGTGTSFFDVVSLSSIPLYVN